jgi:hypothetical protein
VNRPIRTAAHFRPSQRTFYKGESSDQQPTVIGDGDQKLTVIGEIELFLNSTKKPAAALKKLCG